MNTRRDRTISRRTVLRAAGVTVALPWLEAMGPAGAAEAPAGPVRTVFMYAPNGMYMPDWAPPAEGRLDKLSEILEPLAAHKGDFSVLGSLANMEAFRVKGGAMHAPARGRSSPASPRTRPGARTCGPGSRWTS